MANIENVSTIALEFVRNKGYSYVRLDSIVKENDVWTVIINPLLMYSRILIEIKVDDISEEVIGFKQLQDTGLKR